MTPDQGPTRLNEIYELTYATASEHGISPIQLKYLNPDQLKLLVERLQSLPTMNLEMSHYPENWLGSNYVQRSGPAIEGATHAILSGKKDFVFNPITGELIIRQKSIHGTFGMTYGGLVLPLELVSFKEHLQDGIFAFGFSSNGVANMDHIIPTGIIGYKVRTSYDIKRGTAVPTEFSIQAGQKNSVIPQHHPDISFTYGANNGIAYRSGGVQINLNPHQEQTLQPPNLDLKVTYHPIKGYSLQRGGDFLGQYTHPRERQIDFPRSMESTEIQSFLISMLDFAR